MRTAGSPTPTSNLELRLAAEADMRTAYEWMCCSDVTPRMMGPPDFPDNPIPTREEFEEDWSAAFRVRDPMRGRCFFIRVEGDEVGVIAHNDVVSGPDGEACTELDIWMRDLAHCGRGFGPRAIDRLCRQLAQEIGVRTFFLQPSARNPGAIRAYEKAGFRRIDLGPLEAAILYRTRPDYRDSVFIVRRLAPGRPEKGP